MNRLRHILLISALSVLTAWAEKPNILFILADDHAFDTIHALGNEEIRTPHIDKLVQRGTTFTHTYNMGGYHGAVCVASRTMLNTGRFVWSAQQVENEIGAWQDEEKMWSQLMATAGYDTYFTGKWHVKAKAERIFKNARHVRGGMPKQVPEGYNRPHEGKPDKWSPYDPKFGGFWEGGKHWSEVVKDDAVDFMVGAKESDNPFFMYIAFNAPHDPRQAPKEFVDMYPLDKIATPQPFLEMYPYKDKIGCSPKLRDEKLAPFPRTEYSVKVNRQEYYAIITHMDEQIGLILDSLEASGKADNTWIFFTADHGLSCGHHGLLGKQNMYDHSVRVPFMVVGPEVRAGAVITTPIYMQDVMPTCLELAGAAIPEYVQFKSITPLLAGKNEAPYESIYGAYTTSQRMVTQDGWKLIHYPAVPIKRLYNVANDPQELNDVASKHPKRVAALSAELARWQTRVGDPIASK